MESPGTARHQDKKKKKKTSLLSFSERQNVALPSFCCLSSRFKIFYLPCSHGEQRHSRKDRTRCSDQYQRPPYGPRLLPSEGMSALCVFVNEREHLCVFFFSSSDLFLICIQSQTIFKDLQMCRCVFREHPPQHSITITVNKSPAFNTVAKWELPLSIFPFQHFSLSDILNITEHRNTGLSRVM